jgi:hypothetical protein
MKTEEFKASVLLEYRRLKKIAEAAMAQVTEADFVARLQSSDNSIAIVVKHIGGNMKSRWRDFLTTDGEKSDRNRDAEFEVAVSNKRQDIMACWDEGWKTLFDTLESLTHDDFVKTVHIRREPHTVIQAIQRNLTHTAYHVGQIVLLAKHLAGDGWQHLSVPLGGSARHRRPYLIDE